MPLTYELKDFVFVPIEEATVSPGGLVMCYRNRWWGVDGQDRISYYNPVGRNGRRLDPGIGAPQCNGNEDIARRIMTKYPWVVDVRLLPFVFHSINPADYVH